GSKAPPAGVEAVVAAVWARSSLTAHPPPQRLPPDSVSRRRQRLGGQGLVDPGVVEEGGTPQGQARLGPGTLVPGDDVLQVRVIGVAVDPPALGLVVMQRLVGNLQPQGADLGNILVQPLLAEFLVGLAADPVADVDVLVALDAGVFRRPE